MARNQTFVKPSLCPHIHQKSVALEELIKKAIEILDGDGKAIREKILDSSITAYVDGSYEEANLDQKISPMDHQLHACLECSFTGALNAHDPHKQGWIKHSFQTGHFLALNLHYGELFCCQCQDYIYDPNFDQQKTNLKAQKEEHQIEDLIDTASRKRKRDSMMKKWWDEMGQYHFDLHDSSHANNTLVPHENEANCLGLRGLYNMGNTCFMSCILQCLLHNPMVRNFFLTDSHNAKLCTSKGEESKYCLACDMDDFFNMMFFADKKQDRNSISTNGVVPKTAIVPHQLLYSMWQHAQHLAGYDQQDAHEFFMGLLDGIHSFTHCNVPAGGASPRVGRKGLSLCNCVIHQTFAGVLRSDVTCGECHSVSTAYDPFFDLSLSLDKIPLTDNTYIDLEDILNRFTREEHLNEDERPRCEKCQSYQDCIKKLSIRTLPNVMCIHFKRFDAITRSKISTLVKFRAHEFDPSPYVYRAAETNVASSLPKDTESAPSSLVYDLFAVVNHHGTMNSGHYTNFARYGSNWYKFDDAYVTQVDEEEVLESEAYLLFYARRHLQYEE